MLPAATKRHCLVAISSHGFGHLSQVAPVLNQFAGECLPSDPTMRFTLRTTLPPEAIAKRVVIPFDIDLGSDDFGMVMFNALQSNVPESLRRYKAQHADWESAVDALAQHLSDLKVDVLFADIPYLTLAAAARVGIPSVAMCSLNWADILEQSVAEDPTALATAGLSRRGFEAILQTMREAYASASVFLQPEPSMAMSGLSNLRRIEPVSEPAANLGRESLVQWVAQAGFKDAAQGWFVLVSMGGIPTTLKPEQWPTHCLGRPLFYLVTPDLAGQHPHAVTMQAHGMQVPVPSYQVLIAASDVVLSKPGYGTFVEACVAGTPVLYVARPAWPESAALNQWIDRVGHARQIDAQQLATGNFEAPLCELLAQGRSKPLKSSGAAMAATAIRELCP
ncbi:MAG: hypothetical protein R6V42_09730 [Orrella sp.]